MLFRLLAKIRFRQRTNPYSRIIRTVLKRLEQMFEHYRGRYFAVGGLGYDE